MKKGGSNGIFKITKRIVSKVKKLLHDYSIHETSRLCGVSYYTAWCISKGKYNDSQVLQPGEKKGNIKYFDITDHDDWIIGGKVFEKCRNIRVQ